VVSKWKEELELFNQGALDKKKKDKKGATGDRPKLPDSVVLLA